MCRGPRTPEASADRTLPRRHISYALFRSPRTEVAGTMRHATRTVKSGPQARHRCLAHVARGAKKPGAEGRPGLFASAGGEYRPRPKSWSYRDTGGVRSRRDGSRSRGTIPVQCSGGDHAEAEGACQQEDLPGLEPRTVGVASKVSLLLSNKAFHLGSPGSVERSVRHTPGRRKAICGPASLHPKGPGTPTR